MRREDDAVPLRIGRAAVDRNVGLDGNGAEERRRGAGCGADGGGAVCRTVDARGFGGLDDGAGGDRLLLDDHLGRFGAAAGAIDDDEGAGSDAEKDDDGEPGEDEGMPQDGGPRLRAGDELHAGATPTTSRSNSRALYRRGSRIVTLD